MHVLECKKKKKHDDRLGIKITSILILSESLCKYIIIVAVAFLMEYYPLRIIMGRIDQPPGYAQLTQEI